jgi:arginine/lysine/ornithine decarboxylase
MTARSSPQSEAALEQRHAPLFDAVVKYARSGKVSFHTPGHKHGRGIYAPFLRFLGRRVFSVDLTLLEEVDSLHEPRSVIKEAQRLAARTFGADDTYFLVNGTSVGNQTMIWASLKEGERVVIPRNVHRSVFAGLIMTGARPVYVTPPVLDDWGIYGNIGAEQVLETLKANMGCLAVMVNHPTYYGLVSDLPRIVGVAHRAGAVCLVDEAHGPHFAFHEALPPSAMSSGADMAAQSTHKVLGAMTQASMLHMKGGRVDKARLKMGLQLLQSTSPSYVLLASLDVARLQMALSGRRLLDRVIGMSRETARALNRVPGIRCFGPEHCGRVGAFAFDETRIMMHVDWPVPGYEVARRLRDEYRLQPELADAQNVLFLIAQGNTWGQLKRLVSAMRRLERDYRRLPVHHRPSSQLPVLSPSRVVLTPREAVLGRARRVPLSESIGEVCAELLSPYPPGVPLVAPGELITKEAVNYLTSVLRAGGRINGQADMTGRAVRIVEAAPEKAIRDMDFDKMLAFVLNQNASGEQEKT